MSKWLILIVAALLMFTGCRREAPKQQLEEDSTAKKMLQGIWVNDDQQDVAFMAKGDTIYYPDQTYQPAYFKIVGDTLFINGSTPAKYVIIKQAPHLFIFTNQTGDQVKLIKSSDPADRQMFIHKQPVALNLNQGKLIKKDTVVTQNGGRYHLYVQVNPTTYKVFKTTYNDEGVAVDNVYYDNIIHVSVFKEAEQIYSHDFYKRDFSKELTADVLRQTILSDMHFGPVDAKGFHFITDLVMPDSPTSFLVDVLITNKGHMSMHVAQ